MWTLQFKPGAKKIFTKIDRPIQKRILQYLNDNVAKNPRKFGAPLTANLAGYWRYRVGDYRIICEIKDKELIVFVIDLGHRSEIYDK